MPSFICMCWGVGDGDGWVRRSHSPGLMLYGQQGLVLTLAVAAGWADVCYGAHMADTVGHKNVWLGVGQFAPPKLWRTYDSGCTCLGFPTGSDSLEKRLSYALAKRSYCPLMHRRILFWPLAGKTGRYLSCLSLSGMEKEGGYMSGGRDW